MNCLECQEILQRRLDGEGIADPGQMKEHLVDCPQCRQRHRAALLLLEKLPSWTAALPTADLRSRIVTAVLVDRTLRLARRRRVMVALALAACLLLAALASLTWLPIFDAPSPGPDMKFQGLQANKGPAPTLEKSVEEARQAVAALSDKGKEQVRMLIAVANPMENPGLPMPGLADVEQPLEPAAESLRQAGRGVSEGLQTVTQSAQRAVAYFFRELPPGTVAGTPIN
jgi:hypothetical protein